MNFSEILSSIGILDLIKLNKRELNEFSNIYFDTIDTEYPINKIPKIIYIIQNIFPPFVFGTTYIYFYYYTSPYPTFFYSKNIYLEKFKNILQ
jgi:hypothetical protein